MKRGEIYYITDRNTIGREIQGARLGVIVSNDILNQTSDLVEVVYLTARPKKALPTHAIINATGRESTVLCEQVDTVSTLLVGDYCGTCTAEEMAAIDHGLLASLSLSSTNEESEGVETLRDCLDAFGAELERVQAERDRYARMLDMLLAEREGAQ
jgi:mRNA interferase MazF